MKVLGHFDRDDLERRFVAAGLYTAIEAKGFSALELHVHSAGMALPHIQLHGDRDGSTALLLDACLSEALVRPTFFHERGFAWDTAVELALVYWVREQDPSRAFTGARPPLPLQEHPGLGVLPMAFQVVRDMAVELGKDGVACQPKFFHDAYIFYHSRLFLFLDGCEQGRFERMLADLEDLPLGHASLALLNGHVRDTTGREVTWSPGYQVCPLSPRLTGYFNSGEYATCVDSGTAAQRFEYETSHRQPALGAADDTTSLARDNANEEEK